MENNLRLGQNHISSNQRESNQNFLGKERVFVEKKETGGRFCAFHYPNFLVWVLDQDQPVFLLLLKFIAG